MTQPTTSPSWQLPHHRLVAYQVAVELLRLVKAAEIRDSKLRDQALRAAKSVCLNIADGAGRVSPADKARVFAIARGEVVEAAAAVEIAELAGDAVAGSTERCNALANRVVALLTGLIRR
jgi:four helix bundle protein